MDDFEEKMRSLKKEIVTETVNKVLQIINVDEVQEKVGEWS